MINKYHAVIFVVRVYYLWTHMPRVQGLVCVVSVIALAIALGYACQSFEVSSLLDSDVVDSLHIQYFRFRMPFVFRVSFLIIRPLWV